MKKSLQKILEELNKESPRLDYIKGMLEVLIDDENTPVIQNIASAFIPPTQTDLPINNIQKIDEEIPPASVFAGPIGRLSQ